eukprot:COSAG02_NODE_26296_length_636_cov_0.769088_1_plen_156_part_10
MLESSQSGLWSGNCDRDVDECGSRPCVNNATCSESNSDQTVPPHTYRCACTEGYAGGLCNYSYIEQVTELCTISDSGEATDEDVATCSIDVDECISGPCMNGAECTDSSSAIEIPTHAYTCLCQDGYAGGLCSYNEIVPDYLPSCTISSSAVVSTP